MTFGARTFQGMSPNGPALVAGWDISADVLQGSTAAGGIIFNTNGTMSFTGTGSGSAYWFGPLPQTGIGSSYWIVASGFYVRSITSLGTAQSFSSSRSAVGITSGTATIKLYSDSGGTQLVATWSVNINLIVESGS